MSNSVRFACLLLALAWGAPANSFPLPKFLLLYEAAKKVQPGQIDAYTRADDFINTFAGAAITSYMTANAELRERKQPPLFCAPGSLPFLPKTAIEIIKNGADKVLAEEQKLFTAEAVLLFELQAMFPCE